MFRFVGSIGMWTVVRQGYNRCSVAVIQMRLGLGFDGTKKKNRGRKSRKEGGQLGFLAGLACGIQEYILELGDGIQ